ncbi:MAG: threonine synthase [Bacteroidales bacterium]|jgi:threonine synthase|nr:threonine synthase [Bacteroidales bacterium]
MKYYSTNGKSPKVSLKEAVVMGLAPDGGLFMPERIEHFEDSFFYDIRNMSFPEISFEVARKFFGDDIDEGTLKKIVFDTLSFDCPLVRVDDDIYSLELFHGPTLAFKDVGARFMARLLSYFINRNDKVLNVLVATSGDTGSAVANGFLGVEGIHVYVLYPKGRVSKVQESQFTTLGHNITALEIDGNFDDCQRLVKSAFSDAELNSKLDLTSANSINVARFLPQSFYYFNAFARLDEDSSAVLKQPDGKFIISVPSGNFGNLTAGLFAQRMGLPVSRFIAANNENDIVYEYLKTSCYRPRASVRTIANAMDVGNPSNFVRILNLYGNSHEDICRDISGFRYSDDQIRETIGDVYHNYDYITDPHGACAFQALYEYMYSGKYEAISGREHQVGVFLETAHPAKFKDTVEPIIGKGKVPLPSELDVFMKGCRKTEGLPRDYKTFKDYLIWRTF